MNPHLTYDEILSYIDTLDLVAYARSRNHLKGAVSKLSPYITRGVIDLPTIRDHVLRRYTFTQAEKFIQELTWREYFHKVWLAKGDAIFTDLRFPRSDWAHHELTSSITHHTTGINVIDQELKTLFETGYMHNHARMWTAMLACNIGKAHWLEMGRFLYFHLLDGDLASNMLSWQWVAGTSTAKQYSTNQKLIDGCSSTTQPNSYLDHPIEVLATNATASQLIAHEAFTYTTTYPPGNLVESVQGETVLLYHPWSLDPLWRSEETGRTILVIEPSLFDRFPVSANVMDFIIKAAHTHIPDITIFVGEINMLPGIAEAKSIFSKRYPATTHWPGTIDRPAELFPSVIGYYPSFFKFWQACVESAHINR